MNTIQLQFEGDIWPLWDWKDRTTPVPSTITDIYGTHRIGGVGVVSEWSIQHESTRSGAKKKLTITVESYQPIE